jgi:hypothetical protein
MANKPPEEPELMERYRLLVLETSERVNSIRLVLEAKTSLHGVLAREFCFLQLRMICECVAMLTGEPSNPVRVYKASAPRQPPKLPETPAT